MTSQMNPEQAAEVVRIAEELGIAPGLFDGWQGHEFALYQDMVGRSSSLSAAVAEAEQRAARGDWTLDLGIRAVGLPRNQGTTFKARLEAAGISIGTWSQTTKYIKRIHSIAANNADVLRELGKR
jgi:hypothetical protein